MGENGGSKVSYLIVGLGLGALVGILFAPKSGEETREFLAEKTGEGSKYAQRKARELKERAEDLVEKSKEVARGRRNRSPRRLLAWRGGKEWARTADRK